MMFAVCAEAGKKCNYLMDDYSHCWDTNGDMEYPGKGGWQTDGPLRDWHTDRHTDGQKKSNSQSMP